MDITFVIVLGIIVILVVSILGSIICKRREHFVYPERNINAAILFAAYKLNEHDYSFIQAWNSEIPFYVVVNGEPTEWDNKVIQIVGEDRYINRPNEGYDAYAWKEGITRWKDQLSEYDSVALINNSCIYGIDMKKFFAHAIDYDMYGLHPNCLTTFKWHKLSIRHHTQHLQSYCIAIGKRLFNSDDFRKYWDELPEITSLITAIMRHELRFSEHFYELGYKLGTYTFPLYFESVYKQPSRKHGRYYREFIKIKDMKAHADSYNKYTNYITRMRENGYD